MDSFQPVTGESFNASFDQSVELETCRESKTASFKYRAQLAGRKQVYSLEKEVSFFR